MKILCITVALVIAAACTIQLTSALLSRNEVITKCTSKKANVLCLGFNKPNATGPEGDCGGVRVAKCTFAFAALEELKPNEFKVHLVGAGSGWVGIGFSNDSKAVMAADNLAVVCINGVKGEPVVQILQIQALGNPAKPFKLDNMALNDSVSEASLVLDNGWMVCEFILNGKAKHTTTQLDLEQNMYKIGLAVHPTVGVDPDDTSKISYHGETKGSSAEAMFVHREHEQGGHDHGGHGHGSSAGTKAILAPTLICSCMVLISLYFG